MYDRNLFTRYLRRLLSRFRVFDKFYLSKLQKKINENNYKYLIILDSVLTEKYLLYIKSQNPEITIIYFFSNNVSKKHNINMIKDTCSCVFSFDKNDCKKFGLIYSPMFLLSREKIISNQKFDIFFCGLPKNRIKQLKKFKKLFDSKGFKSKIIIVEQNPFLRGLKNFFTKEDYSHPLSLHAFISEVSKSKVVLCILSDGQEGITGREALAIYQRKKIITTNTKIFDYIDFIDYEENILVLNEKQKLENLSEFIKSPSKKSKISDGIETLFLENWAENLKEIAKNKI